MRVGVLALQGSFKDHLKMLDRLDVDATLVRLPRDLDKVNGLIIPGGESTTIGRLIVRYGLDKVIKFRCNRGMPIYGTCAGAILLAREIVNSRQPRLALMDISVKRNDYGRQIDSFEVDLDISDGKPFRGIFIRAPTIISVGKRCKVLSRFQDKPVLVEQENLLASTFHPELVGDTRIHKYFIEMVKKNNKIVV